MTIEIYFKFLISKYNLSTLYYKFIFLCILTSILREGFYWTLLLFSNIVQNKPELLYTLAALLVIIICLNIPVDYYYKKIRADLNEQIILCNDDYFNKKIINMSKEEILNFNLVKYHNTLTDFNINLVEYVTNFKIMVDIPIRCTTLIIIAINKKFIMLIGLFLIFIVIIKFINKKKLKKEFKLTHDYFNQESIIRNYIINSKNLLINDEFNNEYYANNTTKFEEINRNIVRLNTNLDLTINMIMFIFIIIVVIARIKNLTAIDFFVYFLIVYDIEFISDKINTFYRNKINYNKMQKRFNYLSKIKSVINNPTITTKITNIEIKHIEHKIPKINNTTPLIFKQNEHILLTGESGSGKTSLLYVLKGMLKVDKLDIIPNINLINNQTYLTLSNHKSMFSSNLHDIITNYDNNTNIELVNFALSNSKLTKYINTNNFVDIEKLSGGERLRFFIARLIYSIKTGNYNILLFDEIDENLNNTLALEICKNLRHIFNDKIIIYITHNEKVKELFTNKITVINGVIQQQKN